eukprot:TRINITY_DN369_c0_g1_i1.p1 TRINITY_DN369_c0_g1~~TRINITY_DN369_c0_g1_i1.p1  ORF type:complete len:102 (+),score=13.87 TRINITY_DN369_c0_g1_i1:273-578(+)
MKKIKSFNLKHLTKMAKAVNIQPTKFLKTEEYFISWEIKTKALKLDYEVPEHFKGIDLTERYTVGNKCSITECKRLIKKEPSVPPVFLSDPLVKKILQVSI